MTMCRQTMDSYTPQLCFSVYATAEENLDVSVEEMCILR